LWTHQFGSSGWDRLNAVSTDESGVYVAGNTSAVLPGQTSSGDWDAFVRKYDPLGNEVWTAQFGSSSYDEILAISVDSSGVFVAGYTDGALPGQSSAGGSDAFVRRFDHAGNESWTHQFGTSSPLIDQCFSIAVHAGEVYVTGRTAGTLPGQTFSGWTDAFVRKYGPAGTVLWTHQFGTSSFESGRAILADASGVYVSGYTGGALPGQIKAGGMDTFVRKYDSAGTEIWTRQFGTSAQDLANAITIDPTGLYTAGEAFGSLPGETSAGNQDAYVVKMVP
jgi:hypothetical protein